MNQEKQILFNRAILAGKTKSYAYRVAQGRHKLNGRPGPAKLYPDLNIADAFKRWKVDKVTLAHLAADLEIPYRTLQRRLTEYKPREEA